MTHEHDAGDGDLIISGRVGALRELAGPPALSEPQARIVHWYAQLVRLLSGPVSGDERGPARQPSWVKPGPQIERVEIGSEERREYLVEGSGFATTQAVWVNGREVADWQVRSPGRLTIPVTPEQLADDAPLTIMIRTAQGDVAIQLKEPLAPLER